jgi:hypothetical protein
MERNGGSKNEFLRAGSEEMEAEGQLTERTGHHKGSQAA